MIMSVYKGQITLCGKAHEGLFCCTVDSGQHVEASLTSGRVLLCVGYGGDYYPISGDRTWWVGHGFPRIEKEVIVTVGSIG